MDGMRLVAIAEPSAARLGGSGRPASERPTPAASDVLDRVVASRLDRGGAAVRWGVGAGVDDTVAATRAAVALRRARERGSGLAFTCGDPWRDALLADLALALAALIDDLTPRQAQIATLLLVDGARQAEVAASLGVSRATVSVAVARGHIPAIAGVRRAIEALLVGPPAEVAQGRDGATPAVRSP